MIKKKQDKSSSIEIDLTGPEGNAYHLLGLASAFARNLNLDANKIKDEMVESDYENLIQVFDKYFGDYVILYR